MALDKAADKGEKPKPRLTVSRMILFPLLGVAIVAIIVDRQARSASQSAYATVSKALESSKSSQSITTAQVRQLLGREPNAPRTAGAASELYWWQGVPRRQILELTYERGDNGPLANVALRDELPW
jgi:hypothetical protein